VKVNKLPLHFMLFGVTVVPGHSPSWPISRPEEWDLWRGTLVQFTEDALEILLGRKQTQFPISLIDF